MSRKRNPWGSGGGTQGEKAEGNINGKDLTREKREKLAVGLMAELGFPNFKPPPPNPIIERACRQLKFEELIQTPRFIVRENPYGSLADVQRDGQLFANKYRQSVCIMDPEGGVLAFCEPS